MYVHVHILIEYQYFFQNQNAFFRKPRRPGHTKVRRIHMQFINMWMAKNPEMTASNIQGRLEKQCGIQLSKENVCMLRRKQNWTPKHMKYGQMISHKNVKHRLDWCLDKLISKDSFRDVIYVNESTGEMCYSGRLFFHRHGLNMDKLPAKAPKPKHSYQVNVLGGISHRGRTSVCIFFGIMDSEIYQKILEDNLLPFAVANYQDGFRLYQDNDRKHTSKSSRRWMEEKQLTESVLTTPASSPDLNPIENVWSAMKTYLRSVVKPKKKEELVQGIVSF